MKYEPSLDGLRAVAVTFVVLYHAYPDHFRGGWLGVDVFFVLSGYLITTILTEEIERTGAISFKRFYLRRILRLAPAVFCLYLFQALRAIWSTHRGEIATATAVSFLYFMNWSRAFDLFPQDILGHTWSLSMEEQFYLLWPFALGMIIRNRPRLWIVATITVILVWRSWLCLQGSPTERTYNGFDTHADALLIGCLLAVAPYDIKKVCSKFGPAALVIMAACVFLVPYDAMGVQTMGLTVMAGLAACVISAAVTDSILGRLLSLSPLVFTGRISYAWYLWHYPLIMLAHFHGGPKMTISVTVICSYAAAVASYFFIERPFLKLKAHL